MTTAPTKPTAERDTLTLAELAERMGLGKTTAYQMAQKNELPIPALRIGREYRFSRRAFERWLDSGASSDSGNAACSNEIAAG